MIRMTFVGIALMLVCVGCQPADRRAEDPGTAKGIDARQSQPGDAELESLVRRSYQYVAMYNVNNKFAMDPANPASTGGWNQVRANTALLDHTVKAIARPNNDTLYVTAMIDVTAEPVILVLPAFDSTYVSLMVTGYDHYVNVPMSTRLGDFAKPSRILFYSARTPGYDGEPVAGVDRVFEATGDFLSAVIRVMPHTSEPERLARNRRAMETVKVTPLSEYRSGGSERHRFALWSSPSGKSADLDDREDVLRFPPFGATDFDVFEENLLEVMQFVFNHTTFDPDDELDQALLDAFAPLGIRPGRPLDAAELTALDGARVRAIAEHTAALELARATDGTFMADNVGGLFRPKGKMTLERLLFQSVVGPIGLPATEAVYPAIGTSDSSPMSARHDWVIRMTKDELPPATAFWSITLYDSENGFFIPNDRKKYSVGVNGGMRLDTNGGISVHIAAAQPEGVPEENWLPIVRGDYDIDAVLRVYAPDADRLQTWSPPLAQVIE